MMGKAVKWCAKGCVPCVRCQVLGAMCYVLAPKLVVIGGIKQDLPDLCADEHHRANPSNIISFATTSTSSSLALSSTTPSSSTHERLHHHYRQKQITQHSAASQSTTQPLAMVLRSEILKQMTLMWLLFWTLSFYQISSFSYYFDWRPSLGVKERHPQTRPYPTHRPNGPRCDRGQGWLEPQGSQGDTLWTDKISETDRRKTLPRHLC